MVGELSESGASWQEIEGRMEEARRGDVDWRGGRIAVYAHFAGDAVLDVAKRASQMFFSENGLGPAAFPSLARFEREVLAMTIGLMHGSEDARGTMTSGGTESIFLAVKTARDWARVHRPSRATPKIVAPMSAHPAFNKAAHYLGLEIVRVPIDRHFRADVGAMARAVDADTIMLVGSAPAFPHGLVDPIPELAALAAERGLWLHVDACVGGYFLPFARDLGESLPVFDFALPGVASMSADLHKFGFTAKGASTVLYADEEHFRFQAYEFDDWPRGRYFTQGFAGTRPGGPIAAAWAVMTHLGAAGYRDIVRRILAVRRALERSVGELGLEVIGRPDGPLLAYGSSRIDVAALAEALGKRGWFVSRLKEPPGIHMMLTIAHEPVVQRYLDDIAASLKDLPASPGRKTEAAVQY
ncbi:MAG: aspartate aminotransferase family protein [Proteobacteria bacterium]|nr:aspartate aminotransferase family protein [Pseudomonadota bacterium]MBI3505663.1 aspartate aminotransferase family protein [Pseudomonadota bacterium]